MKPIQSNATDKKVYNPRKQELIFYLSIVVLPVIQFLIFYVFVNLNSFRLAFSVYDYEKDSFVFAGFENFAYIINNFKLLNLDMATKYSLLFYVIGLFVSTPLSLFFSFYVYKKMPLHGVFQVLMFLPSIISSIILINIYDSILEDAIPEIYRIFTGERIPGLLSTNPFLSVLIYGIYMGFGSGVLLYTSAMSKVDNSIVEAAELDGITSLKEFFLITFPMIFPTFSTFIVIGVAGIFVNQHNLFSFFGGGAFDKGVGSIGYYIYVKAKDAKDASNDFSTLGALGLMFSFITIPVTMLVRYLLNKIDPSEV
ncbi:MAG: sugar ABC transporter permease [Clostridia bacterium]|nr:sugar ABC transporter permease [Clostridia bacterium]